MNKIKLIFDISIFYYGYNNSKRAGIFHTSYNILLNMINHPQIEVYAYANPVMSYRAFEFINSLPDNIKTKIKYIKIQDKINKAGHLINKISFLNEQIENEKNQLFKICMRLFRKLFIKTVSFPLIFYKEDIIQYDIYFSPVFAPDKLFKNMDKIVVLLYDTILIKFPHLYKNIHGRNFWYNVLIDSLNKQTIYFAISKSVKNDFLSLGKIDSNKIFVTYLAASENFYPVDDMSKYSHILTKYNIEENEKYIYSLCSLEPRKNIIYAIESFVEFIEEYNIGDLTFVLGGSLWVELEDELNNTIYKYEKYKHKIKFIGYVDDDDLKYLYSAAFLFIYPSIYEGFGLPILEAMKCGAAVISSNTSSMPEVGGDAVMYIDPYDKKTCINALEKIYFNDNLRNHLKIKAIERAGLFSWENTINEMFIKFSM